MLVQEIMATNVAVVDRNDNLGQVEELMAARGIRHVPVIAIVTQRDLFKAAMSSAMGYGEKARNACQRSRRSDTAKGYWLSPGGQ